jgi:hypothetical protein
MHHGEIEAGLVAGGLNVPPDWRRKAELIDLSSHLEFLTTQRSDALSRDVPIGSAILPTDISIIG